MTLLLHTLAAIGAVTILFILYFTVPVILRSLAYAACGSYMYYKAKKPGAPKWLVVKFIVREFFLDFLRYAFDWAEPIQRTIGKYTWTPPYHVRKHG